MVSKPKNKMEKTARGWNGHGEEKTRFRDREAERGFGKWRRRRRLQQTFRPKLGRWKNNAVTEKTQTKLSSYHSHVGKRELVKWKREMGCQILQEVSKYNVGYCFSPSLSSGLRGRMQIRGICTIGGAERASVSAVHTFQRKDNGTFFVN